MNMCPDEDILDRYVMNALTEEQAAEIEEHYFNCPACFQKISERQDLVDVIRARGAEIFEGMTDRLQPRATLGENISTFLTRRRWAAGAAAAAVLLVAAALLFIPKPGGQVPEFVSTGDPTVRGESVVPRSPLGGMSAAPAVFEWDAVPNAASYRITLSGPGTEWTAETREAKAILPEAVRKAMAPGTYHWQVKAYSARGTLLAASLKTEFMISAKRRFPLP